MENEIIINFPTFLTVAALIIIPALAFYYIRQSTALPLIGIQRRTAVTKYGQEVYKMGVPKRVGFDLSVEQINLMEEIFIKAAVEKLSFRKMDIERALKGNKIVYHSLPIRVDYYKTGYVVADYFENRIRLGISPFCHRTGLAHEMVHDILRDIYGDTDAMHVREELWEGGLVGLVNELYRKILEDRGWKL